jgi:CheY-like chemotaxis protein/transcriptional regulator with XRE-family HTH domain
VAYTGVSGFHLSGGFVYNGDMLVTARILVVDDDILIGQLLTYQLGGVGYDVRTVTGGREALEHMFDYQPDLILLDVMMPDMNGWEVCRAIRAGNASTVPIIMLTSKDADSDTVTGLNAGADDYIAKPYSVNQLLARIEAVLRRARQLNATQIRSGGGRPMKSSDAPPQQARAAYPVQSSLVPTLPPPSVAVAPTPSVTARNDGIGKRLTDARRIRGLTLYQAEQACGVRWEFLQALEYEHFNYIPRPQLRQALRTYSIYLNVDLSDLASSSKPTAPPSAHRQVPAQVAMVMSTFLLVLMLVLVLGWQLL